MSSLSDSPKKTLSKKVEGLELAYLRTGFHLDDANLQTVSPSHTKPIVFLHGQFSDKSIWQAQFDDSQLTQEYELLAWDAPGYGNSEMWPHINPSALNFALMLRGWLENEITQPAVFVGHGVGALMACAYAARFPLLVDGIIMIAPQLGFNHSSMFRQRQISQDSNMLNTFGNEPYAKARAKSLLYLPENISQFVEQIGTTSNTLNDKNNHPFLTNYLNVLNNLSHIDSEALEAITWTMMNEDIEEYRHYFHKKAEIWVGQEDQIANEAEARRLAVRYHSRMEIFAETGHMLPIEQPIMFNQHLLRFMLELEQEKQKESEL